MMYDKKEKALTLPFKVLNSCDNPDFLGSDRFNQIATPS